MSFKKNKFFNKKSYIVGSGLLIATLFFTTSILTSCGSQAAISNVSSTPNKIDAALKVNEIYKEYYKIQNTIDPNVFGNISDNIQTNLLNHAKNYLTQANQLLLTLKDQGLKNSDPVVWLESFIYSLGLEIGAYNSNIRYLGGNGKTSYGSYPLSHFNNYVVTNASTAASSPIGKDINPTTISLSISYLNDYSQFLNTLKSNFTKAIGEGVLFSGVYYTLLMQNLISNLGKGDLPTEYLKLTSSDANFSIPTLENGYSLWNPYHIFKSGNDSNLANCISIPKSLSDELLNSTKQAVNSLNSFLTFMINDYATAIKSENGYGRSNDFDNASKTPVENSLSISIGKLPAASSSNTIENMNQYSLSNNDLNTKDIGIGFMKPKVNSSITGKELYKYYLKLSTSTNLDAATIYKRGNTAVIQNVDQMKAVGNFVADIESGSNNADWTANEKYTTDPFNVKPIDTSMSIRKNNSLNFAEFNKWLNSEKWFFGRDGATTTIDSFSYIKMPELGSVNLASELTKNGYDSWKNNSTNYHASTTYKEAYVGSTQSLYSYYSFKDASVSTVKNYFNLVKEDYKIIPYNVKNTPYEGVGSYSGSDSTFYENVDPYYGLQKWSVSSLSLHEAVPGHHFQDKYYKENKEKDAIGFSYTSYAEGWGLFSEWLGVAFGIYGQPNVDVNGKPNNNIPNFKSNAKGFIPTDVSKLSTFQNGVYKSNEEGNALQYFGYLNEAQLRAMRQTLDTGIHSGNDGAYAIGTGWSLQQVRDYMTKNSALGSGDKVSESKRYLSYVGQATSYYTGKLVMQDLFNGYYDSTYSKTKAFSKENYHLFFNYILKNNDIPLSVLINYVTSNLDYKLA